MEALKNYFKDISKYKVLSLKEEKEIINLAKQGNKVAKEKIIKSNLKFVVKVAKQYKGCGVLFDDLISEGNIGLIKALEKFDTSKNVKFISYAVFWIKQTILELISNQGKIMRLPLNINSEIESIKKEIEKQGKDKDTISNEDTKNLSKKLGIKHKNIVYFLNFYSSALSIDRNIQNSTTNSLNINIKSKENTQPDVITNNNEIKKQLIASINKLTDIEKKIIKMRYPLSGKKNKTLNAVGDLLKLSKERVRQIEEKALRKIKNQKKIGSYKSFVHQ